MTEEKKSKEEHLHYLKVLKDNSSTMQKEIRDAIDYSIEKIDSHHYVYVEVRKKLLLKLRGKFLERERLSKEILSLRKELNVLDNMIL